MHSNQDEIHLPHSDHSLAPAGTGETAEQPYEYRLGQSHLVVSVCLACIDNNIWTEVTAKKFGVRTDSLNFLAQALDNLFQPNAQILQSCLEAKQVKL